MTKGSPPKSGKSILELGGVDIPNQNGGKVSVVVDEAKKVGKNKRNQ